MRNFRQFARAAWSVSAAVLVSGALAGQAAGAERPSAEIDGVKVRPGYAEFTLTTAHLPANVSLASAGVRVLLDGQEVDAHVAPRQRKSTSTVPSRAVMLLLDTSGSMSAEDITAARQAVESYLGSLPADVRAGLIAFADAPRVVVAPTVDRAVVRAGLRDLRSGGETVLYDAVHLGVSTLDALPGDLQGRLVVLSDGVDTSSSVPLSAATSALAAKDMPADIVAFKYGANDTSSVRELAAANSGRVLAVDDAAQLSAVFTEIARSFTERARVSFGVPDDLAKRTAVLKAVVGSGASAFSATSEITFAAAPAAAPAARSEGPFGFIRDWWPQWSWQVWAIAGITFGFLLLGTLLVVGLGRRENTGKRVLDQIERYSAPRSGPVAVPDQESSVARAAVSWTEGVLRSRGWEEQVAERLDLAGISMKPGEWTLLRVCTGIVLAALLFVVGLHFLIAVPVGAFLGWASTYLIVSVRISRRRRAFGEQLPDVLQLVAGSLQSGFSLAQALDAVVRDGTQPASGEISRALAETRIGVELEPALERVSHRMASEDMRWIVMAVRIQREVGGNLAEVLMTTVATMRERAQTRRQVRALSAEGRFSAYILLALPFVVGGFFFTVRPEYMRPLYTSVTGLVMIAAAGLFMAIGAFWMSRIVKVEV